MENTLPTPTDNGYGIAGIWRRTANDIADMLVNAMTKMKAEDAMELAWQYTKKYQVYGPVQSHYLNIYSEIKPKLKQKAYTNKKGVKHEDIYEDAHFTQGNKNKDGKFIGWVSKLGPEPISYLLGLLITMKHFRFIHNTDATCMDDFFEFTSFKDEKGAEIKDYNKATLKSALKEEEP
jgi:hypothetical protein